MIYLLLYLWYEVPNNPPPRPYVATMLPWGIIPTVALAIATAV